MTRQVVSVQSDHSIHLAVGLMELKHIRHLPVVQGRRLVGLITHRDLVRAQAALLSKPFELADDATMSIPVARIMCRNVWTVSPLTRVLEAARIVLDHKFGCLPVVEDGLLVGIVTEVDFLRCLVEGLARRSEREDTDPILVG